ncbi:UNVERIFIED_CONTAM: hypothetical protein K2H54_061144 [Gekko kuhli]
MSSGIATEDVVALRLEAASIGFVIIIDRRRDKWSAVKASLTRIAGAFPGNLQLVFVLRPSRFIQRAIADIGIKLYRDDFKMKSCGGEARCGTRVQNESIELYIVLLLRCVSVSYFWMLPECRKVATLNYSLIR